VNRRYQHLRRYRQILEVFLRHGFGYLVQQLDLLHLLPWRRRLFKVEGRQPSPGKGLRQAFEELGPTFIKLGQMLSTRSDIVGLDVTTELGRLQDEVPGIPFDHVRKQIESELECSIDAAFDSIEETPIAAASIGQVHRAVLDGHEVVVKVMRPGIESTVKTDLEILYQVARIARDRYRTDLFDPLEVVEDFARHMRRELDYTVEARNAERFRENVSKEPQVHVPRVYWSHTTSRLLTLELVAGTKVSQIDELKAKGVDLQDVARRGARSFMQQVMIHGFFHGDPHPGNILIEDDGTIAFIDFGLMGRLDKVTIDNLAILFVGITKQDIPGIIRGLRAIAIFRDKIDLIELERDIDDVLFRYYGKPLGELSMAEIIGDLFRLTRKHGIGLPSDFALLLKALLLIEGIGRELDESFNIFEIAEPFAQELLRQRLRPDRVIRKTVSEGKDYGQMLLQLPAKLDTALDLVNQDRLQINFHHQGLEKLIIRLDIASNRLAFALIVAALVIGSSLLVQTNKGPTLLGLPLLGVVGFLIAAFFGIWLIISIVRSGRV
jgi:ubiquinone biosynthesis protein